MTQNGRPRYEDQIRHKNGYSPIASVGTEGVPKGLFPPLESPQVDPSASPPAADD